MIMFAGVLGAMEGFTMKEKREYSQDEVRILLASGMPQERLKDHILTASEGKLLTALADAQNYLSDRYPQEAFVFLRLDNSFPRRKQITFIAAPADTPQMTFAVRVMDIGGTPQISDSYFCDIKRDEVCRFVERALADIGVDAGCDLKMPGLFGVEVEPGLSVEQLLEADIPIGVTGWAFVQAPFQMNEKKAEIEGTLVSLGLQGGFELRVVEGVGIERALQAERRDKSFVVQEEYISLPAQRGE